jgi:hypothetical protein
MAADIDRHPHPTSRAQVRAGAARCADAARDRRGIAHEEEPARTREDRMTHTGRTFVGLAATLLIAGCMSDEVELNDGDEVPTWDEFRASVHHEPWADGAFIVDGDVPIADEAALLDFYEAAYLGDGALIVNRRGNADDRWSESAKQNITYCVSRSSFGTRYDTVVSAMNSATAAWEGAADVNFVHNSSLDGSCNAQTSGVVFDVRQVSGQGYLARAFFPSSSRSQRNVLIDSSSFGNISPWTLTGILRHELGHTLGFRHEHTRPEARTCFEDNSWRALTPYDSASVMHYPQCNGSRTGDLVLTARDRSGAAALYGAP